MKGVPIRPDINEQLSHWDGEFEKCNEFISDLTGEKPGTKKSFEAMRQKGFIDENKVQYTEKGNARYGREQLELCVTDPILLTVLKRRSVLQKRIGTYIRPWCESYNKYGRFYPYFNQLLGDSGGTRTGRMSSNLQQIPKQKVEKDLPDLRTYIYPEDGHILLKRDFNAQEIRVAAHYAEGSILKAYKENPELDVHGFVADLVKDITGITLDRDTVKMINFLKLYGGGPGTFAERSDVSLEQAKTFFGAYDQALPEFRQLAEMIETQVKNGTLLRTWGGRLYDVEGAMRIGGRVRQFYYKMLNVLIQGSSADQTKHAMVRYFNHPDKMGRILLQVHDEIVVTVDKQYARQEMEILRWAMNDMPGWDTPMTSDGATGPSFGELDYD